MKTWTATSRHESGYSLAEFIGVLSIIALLMCILIPRLIGVIEDARLASDVLSVKAMTDATETYFRQYGRLAGVNGAPVATWSYNAYENWDEDVLLAGQFAETAMRSKIATNAYVRLVKVSNTSSTANVLSAVGQVGRLPSFNCNNGYYNMMMQYASVSPSDDGDMMWAAATPVHRNAPVWVALPSISVQELPGLDRFLGSKGGFSHLRWPQIGQPRVFEALNRLRRFMLHGLDNGPGPIRCCYPVPPTWPPPPPGYGGGGDDDPRHDDPGADSEIYAPDSSNPVIVAEVVMQGVTVQNAYRLSLAIDGPGQSNWAFFDSLGRVKYDMYDGSGGTVVGIVFVYLAHK